MQACPNCGEPNAEAARFCSACGASLRPNSTRAAEERKIVSVLFVDLVGFTARSDHADPEDVRATLRVYHVRLKREIERFGGTVEKFVGDAVMAVFGAPVAHEDDAKRAVLAALRIVESIDELNEERAGLDLSVRAAVNTGEAVVALGARPDLGEGFVTGDVVNVASRLQGEAPIGGIVVGEMTERSTRDEIAYEELPPVTVKGKEEPVALWRALGARGRFGVDVQPGVTTPMVGRENELALLRDLFHRVVREQGAQLVTLSGEPGVGKSRLVREFLGFVDDVDELVYWRQGRCLPYGEGITFWALSEVVKSHAGILENDGPDEAFAKLTQAIWAVVEEDAERDWIRARLAPLGRGGGGGAGGVVRGLAKFPRGDRGGRPVRPGLRGPALGGPHDARVHRVPRRLGERCADAGARDRAAGAVRTRSRVGRWEAQPHRHLPGTPFAPGDRAADRRSFGAGGAPRGDPVGAARSRRGEPSVRGGVHPDAGRPWCPRATGCDLGAGRR